MSHLSTGSLLLDREVGGLKRGRLTMYTGEDASGKTLLALAACARAQAAVYIDAEMSLNVETQRAICGQSRFYLTQSNELDVVQEVLSKFVGLVDLIVLDTVTACNGKLSTMRFINNHWTRFFREFGQRLVKSDTVVLALAHTAPTIWAFHSRASTHLNIKKGANLSYGIERLGHIARVEHRGNVIPVPLNYRKGIDTHREERLLARQLRADARR